MKYFTPDLLESLNGDDPDAADREWDKACALYRRRLAKIREGLPREVHRFLDQECLHDADVLGLTEPTSDFPIGEGRCSAHLLVRQDDRLIILHYSDLSRTPEFEPVSFPPHRDEIQPLWLYDEFDVDETGAFVHRILFSSGHVLRLNFSAFRVSTRRVLLPKDGRTSIRASVDLQPLH